MISYAMNYCVTASEYMPVGQVSSIRTTVLEEPASTALKRGGPAEGEMRIHLSSIFRCRPGRLTSFYERPHVALDGRPFEEIRICRGPQARRIRKHEIAKVILRDKTMFD
jgi:hypothetical protein